MPIGAAKIAELERALEVLKTRDRNRTRELRAVKSEIASVRDLLAEALPKPSSWSRFLAWVRS